MTKNKEKTADRDELLNLLSEIYVFAAMKHKACDPWRKALDKWVDRVEALTGWDTFEEIKKLHDKLDENK